VLCVGFYRCAIENSHSVDAGFEIVIDCLVKGGIIFNSVVNLTICSHPAVSSAGLTLVWSDQ